MKTLSWPTLKQAFYIFGLALMLTSTVACTDKGKDRAPLSRHTRVDPYGATYGGGSQSQGEWGVITRSGGFNNILQDFMFGLEGQIGMVSGGANDTTGIRFRGSVQSGQIYILVWDDIANQTGEAFYWPMKISDVQENGNSATIILEDSVGRVMLQGTFSGSTWSGTATFENSQSTNGAHGTLGNFMIGINSVFN